MTVIATDLQTYLGLSDTYDAARATLLIGLATDLCESIVSPLPDTADAVVLSSAARAFVNPSGVTAQTAGPYQQAYPSAGVYLTKAERATLRRLAGGGGAFSIDMLGDFDAKFEDD